MARFKEVIDTGVANVGGQIGAALGGGVGLGLEGPIGMVYGSAAGNVAGSMLFHSLRMIRAADLAPDRFPRLMSINGRLRLMGFAEQLLLEKLATDFELSPLFDRSKVLCARNEVLAKVGFIGSVPPLFAADAQELQHLYPRGSARTPLRDSGASIRRLKRLKDPLSVLCLSIQPAIMAALMHMRKSQGIALDVDHDNPNGVTAVRKILERIDSGIPYDLIFMPNAAFVMAERSGEPIDLTKDYAFVMPVHSQRQHVIRKRTRHRKDTLKGVNYMRFLDRGSAKEQFLHISSASDIALVERPYEVNDYADITNDFEDHVAAVLWDPVHAWVMKSGNFYTLTGLDYRYWMSLYGLRETLGNGRVGPDFLLAFRDAWLECRKDVSYAFGLLEQENFARTDFTNGMRHDAV